MAAQKYADIISKIKEDNLKGYNFNQSNYLKVRVSRVSHSWDSLK